MLGVLVLCMAAASPVGAHSLTGTAAATVTRVDVDVDQLSGSFEVQFGDLASLALRKQIDTDADGLLGREEERAYIEARARQWSSGIDLWIDGALIPVELKPLEAMPRGGATAMAIPMALLFQWQVPLAFEDGRRTLHLREANDIEGAGHRTVVISAADLIDLAGLDPARLESGGHVKGLQIEGFDAQIDVTVDFVPAAGLWSADSTEPVPGKAEAISLGLDRRPAAWIWFLALVLGALHALAPGHGKTMAAAYLVGERGTTRHALLLGLIVAATHVMMVAILGLVLFTAQQWLPVRQVAPWLSAAAGILIIGVGSWLLIRHLSAVTHVAHHEHEHEGSALRPARGGPPMVRTQHHVHAHEHSHPHIHLHLPSTVTTRGLLLLGLSGGILPCASAFALLTMATAESGAQHGLFLLLAFSLGLALVLSGVGVLVIHARPLVERWLTTADGWVARIPVLSALLVCAMGGWTLVRGLMEAGVLFVRW